MLSIYTVEKNIFADNPDIFEYLHNMMRHYLHVFEQYRRKFYRTWIEMKEKRGFVEEKFNFYDAEWQIALDRALNNIASFRG